MQLDLPDERIGPVADHAVIGAKRPPVNAYVHAPPKHLVRHEIGLSYPADGSQFRKGSASARKRRPRLATPDASHAALPSVLRKSQSGANARPLSLSTRSMGRKGSAESRITRLKPCRKETRSYNRLGIRIDDIAYGLIVDTSRSICLQRIQENLVTIEEVVHVRMATVLGETQCLPETSSTTASAM